MTTTKTVRIHKNLTVGVGVSNATRRNRETGRTEIVMPEEPTFEGTLSQVVRHLRTTARLNSGGVYYGLRLFLDGAQVLGFDYAPVQDAVSIANRLESLRLGSEVEFVLADE